MAHKLLQIVSSAYRATIEEQDDTVLWITHALAAASAATDVAVLLQGNAVNYAVRGQDAAGLSIGGRTQTQPPRLDEDVARLVAKGVAVLLVAEDVLERGIERADLLDGVATLTRRELPALFSRCEKIWSW
jgi:intracellular sulfur oxidation DsrE/DsrF family protein